MGMTACPECGHTISDSAAACPSCGCVFAIRKKKKEDEASAVGCGCLAIILAIFYFMVQ